MGKVKAECATWTFKVKVRSLTKDRWPSDAIELHARASGGAAVKDKVRMTRMAGRESAVMKFHGRRPGSVEITATFREKDKAWKAVGILTVGVPAGDGIYYVDIKSFTYSLKNVHTPVHIAPGKDPDFRIEYDIEDEGKLISSGLIEILRKKDEKLLKKVTLKAAQWKEGHQAVAYEGAIDGKIDGFPDDHLTIEHSPYTVRVTIDGALGKQSGTAEVKVEIAKFTVELAPTACLTDDKDKAVYDQIPVLPASDVVKVKLRSNLFREIRDETYDNTAFTEYKKLWDAGPRIPVIAKLTIFNSKDAEVCAGKALGRARVLWDYTDPPQSRAAYLAAAYSPPHKGRDSWGAKPYIDRALAHEKKKGRPVDGDNAHVDRGGKRRNAAGPDSIMSPADAAVTGFPYAITAGGTRWWAAFSLFEKGGKEEAQAGVVFRPARMAGDNYKVKAYLDLEEKLDTEDAEPKGAIKEADVGTFETWRELTIAKRYKKCATIAGVMPSIVGQFADAYMEFIDTTTPVALTKDEYDTAFAGAKDPATGNDLIKKYALEPVPSHYGSPATEWVADFRSYDDFKQEAQSGERLSDDDFTALLKADDLASQREYFEAVASYAESVAVHMTRSLAKDEGITILQFYEVSNLERHAGSSTAGEACLVSRDKAGFVLYHTDADSAQTPAHEIGHNLCLPHSPRIKEGAVVLSGAGITPKRHDGRNRNCLMSYARPREGFCGLCLLRLRGWDGEQFNESGPLSPSLASVNPAKGAAGSDVDVTLTGTGFENGSTINISPAGITASIVVIVNATTITARFTIAADAPTSPCHISVMTPSGETGSREFHLKPTLTAVDPSKAANKPKEEFDLKLTGSYLITGSKAKIGGGKVDILSSTDQKGSSMKSKIRLKSGAAARARNVTVETPGGTTNAVELEIVPLHTIVSITPEKGVRGATVDVTITGTNFLPAASVSIGKDQVTAEDVVITPDRITAKFKIPLDAKLGDHGVQVFSGDVWSNSMPFRVLPLVPTLTNLTPDKSYGGVSVDVQLTGTNFFLVEDISISGSGVTFAGGNVDGAGALIDGKFDVEATAAKGPRDVKVVTEGGETTVKQFEVLIPPPPTLTSMSPARSFGGKTIDVVLTGTNFKAVQEIVLVSSVISVASFTVDSDTQITAQLAIKADAVKGDREVKVKTAGGTTGPQRFTIDLPPKPTLTAINPAKAQVDTAIAVTLTGTNFEAVQAVNVSDANVSVVKFTVDSDTQITAEVNVYADAAEGDCKFTVKTAGGTTGAQTLKVELPPPPTLTSITPPEGEVDWTTSVTLTGTDFWALQSVDITGGDVTITRTNETVTDIVADFAVDAAAADGDRQVTVTTRGGTTGPQAFTIKLPPAPSISALSPDVSDVDCEVDVTITGGDYLAVQSVDAGGGDVTVVGHRVDSDTQITARLRIPARAAPGDYLISVTTRSGTSNTELFRVNPPPPTPTITSVTPNSGAPGSEFDVVVIGTNLSSAQGVHFSAPIAAIGASLDSDTRMVIRISIDASASARAAKVKLTAPGSESNELPFTIA